MDRFRYGGEQELQQDSHRQLFILVIRQHELFIVQAEMSQIDPEISKYHLQSKYQYKVKICSCW